ncbi:phage tail protein [Nannocystaceae bacterium ST9]
MALRSPAYRPFVLIKTLDQWRRCSHDATSLDVLAGTVELSRLSGPELDEAVIGALPILAGLVFDRHCRLYRALPEAGQIHVHRWQPPDPLDPVPSDTQGRELFAIPAPPPILGEFVSEVDEVGPLAQPTGLAVDGIDRLHVWESGNGGLLIWDLEQRRIRERVGLGVSGPVDLAWIGDRLVGVGPELPGMLERSGDGHPHLRSFPFTLDGEPCRIAGDSRGRRWLLLDAGTADARIVALEGGASVPIEIPGASDLVFLSAREGVERLVVARGPDQAMRCLIVAPTIVSEDDPLSARGYDGRGIVRTPDDRVAYFGTRGLRHAVAAGKRYAKRGRVIGFRFDAGEFHNRWGRVFLDACVPTGTELRITTVVTDDPPDDDALADAPFERKQPDNEPLSEPKDVEGTPMPPKSLVPEVIEGRVFERTTGQEIPWAIRDDRDRRHFTTWEGVVQVGPEAGEVQALGRYLWVFVELRGNGRRTPALRSLRVERSGHPLLARLPKLFSRDLLAGEFLWRFLALFDGNLVDLELRTALRHALLHPSSSPEPFLPWLAELLGLVLDERWPVEARRVAIAEASWLFRFRGTVPGLRRLLEIYLGEGTVQIVEHFRVRGLGGVVVGGEEQAQSSAVLGAGFRVGGALGVGDLVDIGSQQSLTELGADGFETHAHRFTVIVLDSLVGERRSVVERILDQHRPAHTIVELCTVDAGLRVGVGLMVGLSSVIGAGSGWTTLQLGASALGNAGIIGKPRTGTSLGGARLGKDSRVG